MTVTTTGTDGSISAAPPSGSLQDEMVRRFEAAAELRQSSPALEADGPRTFEHPLNGYRETVGGITVLWALLFGIFYVASKGLWSHVAIWLILVVILGSLLGWMVALIAIPAWIVYAIAVPEMLANNYRRRGWREVKPGAPQASV